MRNPLRDMGIRLTTGWVAGAAAAVPLLVLPLLGTTRAPWAVSVLGLLVLLAAVTFRGRWLTTWVLAMFTWIPRRRRAFTTPAEPAIGATVMPGDHVAVRWQGGHLVALIELLPRPFTTTVVIDGRAHTDDVIDTGLVELLLSRHCPDLAADIVSAGFRAAGTAPADVAALYEHAIASDPAPARRRTWIMLRAEPFRCNAAALRRGGGVTGLVRYLVGATTRIADDLASRDVDAACERSFDDYDNATGLDLVQENWSSLRGGNTFTTAYTAPGGPDAWWAAPADHTITLVRVMVGADPRSALMLTTAAKPETPPGFTPVFGGQRAALEGRHLLTDVHRRLPIGSAGVLVGETADRHAVYLPFDDVDTGIDLADARTFTQFLLRSAAAGAAVTLTPPFGEFAALIGAQVGPDSAVVWPNATTYLKQRPDLGQVTLQHNLIVTPRHARLVIRDIVLPEERPFEMALPRQAGGTFDEDDLPKTAIAGEG